MSGAPAIPVFDLVLSDEDVKAYLHALADADPADGTRLLAFEMELAERLGCPHVVAVGSGTAALHLALLGAGVGRGDEVVVPSLTFAATASAVVHCGATPRFAEVLGPHDLSLDPDDVAARLTPATKAVVAVHYGGYPAPVDALAALCAERGIALVEDAAHAPAASLDGRALGTWGVAGAFSLFSNKVLAVGEGGFLCTDDDRIAELARRRRGVGPGGFDLVLDGPRAALGLSRLRRLDEEVLVRRSLTRAYRRALGGVDGVEVPFSDAKVTTSTCYALAVLLDEASARDRVRRGLLERHGIGTTVLYPPVHTFSAFRAMTPRGGLPRTEDVASRQLTLPLHPRLGEAGIERVVRALEVEL